MENFLSVYGGNIQIPSANAYGYNDNVSSSQGDSLSPVASTSSASQHTSPDDSEQQRTGLQAASQQQQQHKQRQQQQPQQNKESIPPTTAAKKLPRRSCDPCRLRRVRCVRSAKSNDCEKCLAMGIKCTESAPRARTSQKGARIAQAKMLYGDTTGAAAMALVVRTGKTSYNGQLSPRLPANTETLIVASMDVSVLLNELIPAVAKLKVTRLPLLRWIDITGDFEAANGKLSNMDPISQALFLSLGALSARTSHSELVVGKNAPTLMEVSKDEKLRSSVALCEFGRRREPIAREMLQLALRKLNENKVFATPSLKSAAALATIEMLILVYEDSLAFTRSASRSARPLSAAVASHLRILAEECNGLPSTPFGFYSVSWTAIIRDALVSSVTGRALDFTTNDLFLILKINEDEPISVPSPQTLMESWLAHPLEGPVLMQLWACVLKLTRAFVNEITQPLAVARPRLNLAFFDNFYTTMLKCRMSLHEALALLNATDRTPPDQKRVIAYSMDFMMAQAHRIILWRCSEEQLARAQQTPLSLSGAKPNDDWETYKVKLQVLKSKSTEEAFQAARRIMASIMDIFSPKDEGKAEFFVPGYFVYEGLLVWTSLLLDTRSAEEGGRADYSITEKLKDLTSLREAIAITGWSSGLVQPHLEQLNNIILELEQKRDSFNATSANMFSQYLNFNQNSQHQFSHQPQYQQQQAHQQHHQQHQQQNPLPEMQQQPLPQMQQMQQPLQPPQQSQQTNSYASTYPSAHTGEADPFSLNYFKGDAPSDARQEVIQSNPLSSDFWQSSGFNTVQYSGLENNFIPGDPQPLNNLNSFDSVAIDEFLRSIGFQMNQ